MFGCCFASPIILENVWHRLININSLEPLSKKKKKELWAVNNNQSIRLVLGLVMEVDLSLF